MITIPVGLIRLGHRAAEFAIRNAPKFMAVAGTGCIAVGTVMACNATLKADDILKDHQHSMNIIKKAKAVSMEYTPKDEMSDKLMTYATTGRRLLALYGPAIAVECAGVSMLFGAYGIMSARHARAMAALTAVDQAFADYRARVENEYGNSEKLLEPATEPTPEGYELPWDEDNKEKRETVQLNPECMEDPFFFIFDSRNKEWAGKLGHTGYLYNYNFITRTIAAFNIQLSSGERDHVFLNDILRALYLEETEIGHYYGWTSDVGDVIDIEITPFIYQYCREDSEDFPMMIPVTLDEIKEYECSDYNESYGYGIRFRSPLGAGGLPRMIAKQVF